MQVFVTINKDGMKTNAGRCEYKELLDKGMCDKEFI